MDKLLLLHGALGSRSQFKEQEKLLCDKFEVYSINFSGHGGESIPSEPFSIRLFANDVLKWLDRTKIRKINIFGYSMGGYVALYLARYYPEIAGKIFTLATKFEWSQESAAKEVKMLDLAKIKEKVPEFAKELKRRHFPQDWEAVLAKTSEMMLNLGNNNELTEQDYPEIEQEVMVGLGDRDKMVTIEETVSAYRKLKNGRLIIFPDTPHPLEQVGINRLCAEIMSFFS